jgi:hypothetical protein
VSERVAKNPRERERAAWGFGLIFVVGDKKKKASKWMMEGECKERELWTAFFGVLVWAR